MTTAVTVVIGISASHDLLVNGNGADQHDAQFRSPTQQVRRSSPLLSFGS